MNDLMNLSNSLQLNQVSAQLELSCQTARSYGFVLTQEQQQRLLLHRFQDLRATGRMEFGEGILSKLILTFCDSPYLHPTEYEQTLTQLQTLFYHFKGECMDRLTDDGLLSAMRLVFDQAARGDLDFLANVDPNVLYHAAQTGTLAGTSLEDEALFEYGD